MSPSLSALFESTKEAIDPLLRRHLDNPAIPSPLREAMTTSIQNGGKRLRPALTLACAPLFSVPTDQAAQVGAAVEMVHGYSLIHDDLPVMDNADMRRGPSQLLAGIWRGDRYSGGGLPPSPGF